MLANITIDFYDYSNGQDNSFEINAIGRDNIRYLVRQYAIAENCIHVIAIAPFTGEILLEYHRGKLTIIDNSMVD